MIIFDVGGCCSCLADEAIPRSFRSGFTSTCPDVSPAYFSESDQNNLRETWAKDPVALAFSLTEMSLGRSRCCSRFFRGDATDPCPRYNPHYLTYSSHDAVIRALNATFCSDVEASSPKSNRLVIVESKVLSRTILIG